MRRFVCCSGVFALLGLALGCSSAEDSPQPWGLVILSGSLVAGEPFPFTVDASFSAGKATKPNRCPPRAIANCWLTVCDALNEEPLIDAGNVTVSGPDGTIQLSEIQEADNGILSADSPVHYRWSRTSFDTPIGKSGESITVRVSGSADYPAMEASLIAPFVTTVAPISLSERPNGGTTISWSPPIQGNVEIHIEPSSGTGATQSRMHCSFSGASGSTELSAELLSQLTWPGNYYISGRGEEHVEVSQRGAVLRLLATQ
jgi:hypothetical protein